MSACQYTVGVASRCADSARRGAGAIIHGDSSQRGRPGIAEPYGYYGQDATRVGSYVGDHANAGGDHEGRHTAHH
jgi:hypothetical protein